MQRITSQYQITLQLALGRPKVGVQLYQSNHKCTQSKVRAQPKKTILFGNFSQHGGGVFPNPKTFVNLPSIFLYAKLGPKWPQMVKNMLY